MGKGSVIFTGLFLFKSFVYISAMNLKVTITFIATEEDWDISSILDGRKLSDRGVEDDIKQALMDDTDYILKNSDIIIKEDKDSL
jgi:hypothetical protein